MQKTKRAILASVAIFAMVAMTVPVMAEPSDHEMPAEDDMFWYIFADMSTPDDYDGCVVALDNYIAQYPGIFNTDDIRNNVRSEMTGMCTGVGQMRTDMQTSMEAEGVATSLFDAGNTNWHAINGLYFQKSGDGGQPMGRISFSETIDFMTYRFFNFMSNFGNMVKFDGGYISLNAAMVPDMIDYGATLTMYQLGFDQQPDIYVSSGANMRKAIEGTDYSGFDWNAEENTLTFIPGHFSSFKAVQQGSTVKKMRISSVQKKSIKYKEGKTFKLTVKGKNLYKKGQDVSCTLGSQQAERVWTSKKGKKVTCRYGMDSFSDSVGDNPLPLTVSITGQGEVTKTNAVRVR